jgi:uncharacterized protein YbjQ (UPF0145 family)
MVSGQQPNPDHPGFFTMIGLNLNLSQERELIAGDMFTTSSTLPSFEITKVFGVIEGVSERSFPAVGVGGVGIYKGGEMDVLMSEAKERLSRLAAKLGANAVVGFTYVLVGREVEKSAVAYGTAVRCRKPDASTSDPQRR